MKELTISEIHEVSGGASAGRTLGTASMASGGAALGGYFGAARLGASLGAAAGPVGAVLGSGSRSCMGLLQRSFEIKQKSKSKHQACFLIST